MAQGRAEPAPAAPEAEVPAGRGRSAQAAQPKKVKISLGGSAAKGRSFD